MSFEGYAGPVVAPPRGVRPSNRRQLILATASELFADRGYGAVTMSEIAARGNLSASALYRHFRSKSDLLAAVIRTGIAPYARILVSGEQTAPDDLDGLLLRLAECALDERRLGVLWQREARFLGEQEVAGLRVELRSANAMLASALRRARPELPEDDADLLAWCCLGVLVSVGFHRLELPRTDYVELLVRVARAVAEVNVTDLTQTDGLSEHGAENLLPSRQEEVLEHATSLFASHGFPAVGMDAIGDAVGIAGPSIYNHFDSKQHILALAIGRGGEILAANADAILTRGDDPQRTLGLLVDSYIDFSVNHPDLMRVLVAEMDQLEPLVRAEARQRQRDYVDVWEGLELRLIGGAPVAARVRVQAVLLVVNDAVQTPHLRALPMFVPALRTVSRAILCIPDLSH